MIDAFAAEWLKIRSVLSTYVVAGVLAVTVGLITVLTWYVVLLYDRATPEQRAHVGLLEPAEITAWVAELCMALFGVLAVTSEYRTGMIRTTLGAVPQRLTLLAAKAGVVAVVSLVTGMAALFGALSAGRSILGGRPIQGSSAPLSEAVQLVLASGLLVVVFALVGFGLGAVMRSAAAAIATVAALWYVLPIIALNLPAPWNDRASSVMLINLARELAGDDEALLLSPPWALAAMAAYVTLSLGAAGLSITRRDA